MNKLITMAWRNCWRNKRRTLITAASIFFALFFAIIMRSFQLGTYGHMIKQSIEMFSGYLQVQHPDYFDDPSLDNTLEINDTVLFSLSKHPGVKEVAPRIETFALASTGPLSKGVAIIGIDPEMERKISNPEHFLIKYKLDSARVHKIIGNKLFNDAQKKLLESHIGSVFTDVHRLAGDLLMTDEQLNEFTNLANRELNYASQFLVQNDAGVLLSYKLALYLKVNVGDTLILMGQGYQGQSATGLFVVKGLVKVPAPDLDNKLVYMDIHSVQSFLNLDNRATSLIVNLDDPKQMVALQNSLQKDWAKTKYEVKNWQEINPTLKQQIEGDNTSGKIFVGVLYLIIFFGIFGTVLMMVSERKREFGVLVAIGMRRRLLMIVLVIEMFFIGLMGTVGGLLSSVPIVIWFNKFPIRFTGEMAKMYEDMGFDPTMPTALIESYFGWQALVILLMVLIACYIPLRKIKRLKIMENLHE